MEFKDYLSKLLVGRKKILSNLTLRVAESPEQLGANFSKMILCPSLLNCAFLAIYVESGWVSGLGLRRQDHFTEASVDANLNPGRQ